MLAIAGLVFCPWIRTYPGPGDGLTLICAVGFAFQIFLTSIFVKKYRASVLNFVQMCTAAVLSLVFMAASGQVQFQVTAKGWGSVLYLGIISTTICYLLQTACQKYVDETKAAIILSMESVFGTLFSVIILHESITLRMILGCVIILGLSYLRIPQGSRRCRQRRGICERNLREVFRRVRREPYKSVAGFRVI